VQLELVIAQVLCRVSYQVPDNKERKNTLMKPLISVNEKQRITLFSVTWWTHQQMRYQNVTSLYFATRLAFTDPKGGVPLGWSP